MRILKITTTEYHPNFRHYVRILELEDSSFLAQRAQLYARGKDLSDQFDQLIDQIKQQTNLTISKIAKKYQISEKQLRSWRKGRSAIPVTILKQISKELNIDPGAIENNIDELSSARGQKIKIPRIIDSTLLEILGRFCGDGSCGCYEGTYKFSLKEKGKEFVELHSQDMKKIFSLKGKVVVYPNVAENLIYSKPLVLLFQRIFQYRPGFQKSLNVKPPLFLRKVDWETRKSFTTGLIDTEGSFYSDTANRTVTFEIKMKNRFLIDEVRRAFDRLGVAHNYYATPKDDPLIFRVRSYGKDSLHKIREVFELKNKRHLKQLERFNI